MLLWAPARRLAQSAIGAEILALIALTLSGCGSHPKVPENVTATCATWPATYKYGCTATGDHWHKLADKQATPAQCERLCAADATKASCCYWSSVLGCWMKPGASIATSGTGLATICRPEVPTTTTTTTTITTTTSTSTTTNTTMTTTIDANGTTTTATTTTTITITTLKVYSDCMEANADTISDYGVCTKRCLQSMVAEGFHSFSFDACTEADQDGSGALTTVEESALFCDCFVAADSYIDLAESCQANQSSGVQEEQADECKSKYPSSEKCRNYQLATNETYVDKIFKYVLKAHCQVFADECSCGGAKEFAGDLLACSDEVKGEESCFRFDRPYWQACPIGEKCIPPSVEKGMFALKALDMQLREAAAGAAEPPEVTLAESSSKVPYVWIAAGLGAIIGVAVSYISTSWRRPVIRSAPLLG